LLIALQLGIEYLKSQPTDKMNWSLLESGPYAEDSLNRLTPKFDEKTKEWVWNVFLGEGGCMALVALWDLAWFARYMFEHPEEFRGDLLSVGIEHASGADFAAALTAITGKPSRYVPMTEAEFRKAFPTMKLGVAHSPGYDDPTLWTPQTMFFNWYTVWTNSIGNTGLWTRDYQRLDKIKPDRIRTVEQWMRSVGYNPENPDKPIVISGLTLEGIGEVV
jgi:hypothetical protein